MTIGKVFILRSILSVILLFLFVGHLGLALFSAHWFSLLRNEFWDDFDYPSYKYCSITVTIILAAVMALLVIDLTFEFHKIFARVSGILMITAFAIVIYILTCLTDKKDKELREKAPIILEKNERFSKVNSCSWNNSLPINCTVVAEKYIDLRLNRTFNWFLFYFLSWVISFALAIPLIIYSNRGSDV